jgi:hypothetical protein
MKTLTRSVVMLFTVVLMAAPAARAQPSAGSETAGTTPADDTFVNALSSQGITRERGALIATGHNVCADLKQVAETGPGLVPTPLQVMSALHVLPGQADFVISEAKTNFCPEYR